MSMKAVSSGDVNKLKDSYSSLEFGGQYFLPGVSVTHIQPGWRSKDPLVFQVLPMVQDNHVFAGCYHEAGELKLSSFFLQLPEASFGSAEKVSMTLFDPFEEMDQRYDARRNPYIAFRRKLNRLSSQDEYSWLAGLFKGGKDMGAPLGRDRNRFFFQGLVWGTRDGCVLDANNRPIGLREEDQFVPVISGSGTFGAAVLNRIREVVEAGNEDLLTGSASYYFVAYNAKHCTLDNFMLPQDLQARNQKVMDAQEAMTDSDSVAEVEVESDEGGDSFEKWSVSMLTQCQIWGPPEENKKNKRKKFILPATPFNKRVEQAKKKIRPFGSLLGIPSHEDLVDKIAFAFADKPKVLALGFADTPWLNHPSVQAVFKNRASIPTGANAIGDDVSGGSFTADDTTIVDDDAMDLDELLDEVGPGRHGASRDALRD